MEEVFFGTSGLVVSRTEVGRRGRLVGSLYGFFEARGGRYVGGGVVVIVFGFYYVVLVREVGVE